ncbi:agamous-like MADS-box protein AGL62 [Tanacetum coccineum]
MNPATFPSVNSTRMKKTSQGRRKIEIKKIEKTSSRQVTFSKRRSGLFKKADELCDLTGAEIGIIVESPGGRIITYGHPNIEEIISRYQNPNTNTNTNDASQDKAPPLKEFNEHYLELSKELEMEKRRKELIDESKMVNFKGLPWYKQNIEDIKEEELEQYLSAMVELQRNVLLRADDLYNASFGDGNKPQYLNLCDGNNPQNLNFGNNLQNMNFGDGNNLQNMNFGNNNQNMNFGDGNNLQILNFGNNNQNIYEFW